MAEQAEQPTQQPNQDAKLELTGSRQFTSWLAEHRASLAFTTYQTGKLFLIGMQLNGRLSVFERTFERCMGLATHENSLYMSSLYQVWRFENILPAGQSANGYDRVFVPQVGWTTGDVDVHDIGVTSDKRPIFVNTLFSCLGRLSEEHSFVPTWKPSFISKLAAEDRCHLNGLAMKDGEAAYVTAVSTTDIHEGWREHRQDGGVVIDVAENEIVCSGLSMPHSPRWYQDRLWVADSGNGNFGYVDLKTGKFEPIAFCPGYIRGMAFVGDYAIVGLSKPRENKTFSGLALDEKLKEQGVAARCALQVINLKTGDLAHSLNIDGIVEELYDVVVLEDAVRPMAHGFRSDEIRRTISLGDEETL